MREAELQNIAEAYVHCDREYRRAVLRGAKEAASELLRERRETAQEASHQGFTLGEFCDAVTKANIKIEGGAKDDGTPS